MIVRKTLLEESQRVNELFAVAFEMGLGEEPFIAPEPGVTSWAAFDGDNMMSTFTISDFHIRFDGHSCKMGGVGGVATLPQYRRMGGIRACFQECLPDMYREGYDFSYLYPFSTGYYRKFGFENCVQVLKVAMDLSLLRLPQMEGHFALCEAKNPMKEAIRDIDSWWESRYNMMVIHEDKDYKWTEKFDPCKTMNFTYVYFDKDGAPKAYTTFRMENQPDGRNLQCSKFFFKDKEGFNGLMHLFQSLASDHRFVKFSLPGGQAMEYLMPEWSMGAASWSVYNAGMVRVINVAKVLEKASYHGDGQVTLEISDPQIPENNGCFTVTFEKGQAKTVEKTENVPDARLTIPAFSALIAGCMSYSDAIQWLPGLEDLTGSMAPCQVFRRKPMMIVDYF